MPRIRCVGVISLMRLNRASWTAAGVSWAGLDGLFAIAVNYQGMALDATMRQNGLDFYGASVKA